MAKIICFLLIVFLTLGLWFPDHKNMKAATGSQQPSHISERVRIERPSSEEEAPEEAPDEIVARVEDIEDEAVEAEDDLTVDEKALQDALTDDEIMLEELASEKRYYDETGRVDPFEPFLQRPEPEEEEQDIAEEAIRRTPRTPLERIGLGQLKLTAIINAETDMSIAMVEDPRGKGYILKTGTYIGEDGGRVSKILPDKVIVEEPHRDVFGKTSIRERELQLQKQAGE